MTDSEIEVLQELIKTKTLVWNPDTETSRVIRYIGVGPNPTDPDDIQEPGLCGYLEGGGYIALWNADAQEIRVIADIDYEGKPDEREIRVLSGQKINEINNFATILVPRNFGDNKMEITVCGLCGNTGVLRLPLRHTPYGQPIPPSIHYCLCSNGVDFAQSEKDQAFIPTKSIEAAVARIDAEIKKQIEDYKDEQMKAVELPGYDELLAQLKADPSEASQAAAKDLEEKVGALKAELRAHLDSHPNNPTPTDEGPWDVWESEAEKNPDNGKPGWWAVYGIRHSAFAQASSALEAIKLCDESGDVQSSWESPTAKFIGENPKILS